MRRACAGLVVSAWCLLALAAAARAEGHAGGTAAEPPAYAPVPQAFSARDVDRLKEIARDEGARVRASRTLTLYGFVKFDMAWDGHATDEGNFARWIEPEDLRHGDDQFSATIRETRLGLRIGAADAVHASISGLVEMDFYGGGAENNTQLKLRHAYVRAQWPACRLTVLAGQTWDVCHPRHMPTINYTVGWWAGNVGFRRPQLRVTKGTRFGRDGELLLEAAAARTITGRSTPFTPAFMDTGEDAGVPTLQGRVSVRTGATLGFSGHWGREEHDLAGGGQRDFDTWSAGVDLELPLGGALTLAGEAWLGRNMDAYLGGIGQGMNLTVAGAERAIASRGGWLALLCDASACVSLAGGAALDDPADADLAAGMRRFNAFAFANVWVRWRKRLGLGLELSYWLTKYVARTHGNSLRVQLSVKYEF